jgi:hypothetical protein
MPFPQPSTETNTETQAKPKHPLQQNVTAGLLVTILITAVISPLIKHQIGGYFKTNRINSQLKEILQVPVFSALQKADPVSYSQLEQDITASLNADEPTENQKKIVSTAVEKAFPKYASQASDDSLLNWAQSFQTTVLQDPAACKAQIETNSLADINSKSTEPFLAATAVVIESGASAKTPPPIDPVQVQKSLTTVQTNLVAIHGDSLSLVADPQKMKQDSPKACAIMDDLYTAVRNLPKPEGGALLRKLVAKQA